MPDDLKKNTYGVTKIPGPPQLTFEDVDTSVLQLFEDRMAIHVPTMDPGSKGLINSRVPVIFAGGERFAQVSRIGRYGEVVDRDGKVMKPVISIVRGDIEESVASYKGIATAYPKRKLIHRRITPTGPRKLKTPSGKGVIIGQNSQYVKSPPTEFIVYDRPEYVMITYQIIYWSSFMTQMNEMITLTLQNRDTSNMFYLDLDNGYNLECFIDGGISNQSNLDNFLDEERIIRNQFNIRIAAPIRSLAGKTHDVLVRQSPRTFNFDVQFSKKMPRVTDENYRDFLKAQQRHINPYEIVDESMLSKEDLNPYSRPRRTVQSGLVNPLFSPGRVYDLMIMNPTLGTEREREYGTLGSKRKRERSYIADSQEVIDRIFNPRIVVGGKVQ